MSATGLPPGVSRMQRESPTDATVTVLPSTTTSVAVVPARRSARASQARLNTPAQKWCKLG